MPFDVLEVSDDLVETDPVEDLRHARLPHHQSPPLRAYRRGRMVQPLPERLGVDGSIPREPRGRHPMSLGDLGHLAAQRAHRPSAAHSPRAGVPRGRPPRGGVDVAGDRRSELDLPRAVGVRQHERREPSWPAELSPRRERTLSKARLGGQSAGADASSTASASPRFANAQVRSIEVMFVVVNPGLRRDGVGSRA